MRVGPSTSLLAPTIMLNANAKKTINVRCFVKRVVKIDKDKVSF